ncbi:MAG: transposase [Caldilineaceae bacterium]|nr:transposase [Caldilineaceae bacterium]
MKRGHQLRFLLRANKSSITFSALTTGTQIRPSGRSGQRTPTPLSTSWNTSWPRSKHRPPVVLVLDNASYHHSASGPKPPLLSARNRASLSALVAPLCSDLNPGERFWGFLKDWACANKH